MAFQIPETEPESFRQGDTLKWLKSLNDFPPATWTLNYYLAGSPTSPITFLATDNSDGRFLVNIPAATTATYTIGDYWWTARVSDGSDVHTVGSGKVEIKIDLSAISAAYDGRTHAEIMLDAFEAILVGKASTRQEKLITVAIGGRNYTKVSYEELTRMRDRYKKEVDDESRKGKHRVIRSKFSSISV